MTNAQRLVGFRALAHLRGGDMYLLLSSRELFSEGALAGLVVVFHSFTVCIFLFLIYMYVFSTSMTDTWYSAIIRIVSIACILH